MSKATGVCAIILAALIMVAPLASAASMMLDVKLVSLTSPVAPGKTATLVVQTTPKARCSASVKYSSGMSKATGLGFKNADAKGNVKWTWRVGTKTAAGMWPVTVNCALKSAKGKLDTSLVIAK
jgi:hypothetical protein